MNSRSWRIIGAFGLIGVLCALVAVGFANARQNAKKDAKQKSGFKVVHTTTEWKKILTPEQYHVLREAGTEQAFTGKYWDNHEPGTYYCAACGQELFRSDTKFESGTGWPSFWAAVNKDRVITREDDSFGEVRTEVLCSR